MAFHLDLPAVELHHLDNGLPVYTIAMGVQEVLKLEAVFFAGRPYEQQRLAGRVTAAMLREGTSQYTGAALAEHLDYYGASLSAPFHIDTSNLILFSLKKYFAEVVPLFAAALQRPNFPEAELQAYIQRNKQHLQLDLHKNDVVAYRTVTELFFGADHPYGYNSFPETYDLLSRNDLLQHHQRCFTPENCCLFLSGKVDRSSIDLLNQHLGQDWPQHGRPAPQSWSVTTAPPQSTFVALPDSLQYSLRIGRRLFDRRHPDYHGFVVLNTLLGGYFGSRLMTNLREEKGYTYNISSVLDCMQFDGCFYIGTEVGNAVGAAARTEIYQELATLCAETVDPEELDMVKSYLLGNYLTALDGPFNVSEIIKTLVMEDLPLAFFSESVQASQDITAANLRDLAEKYLQPQSLWEVVVGAQPLELER